MNKLRLITAMALLAANTATSQCDSIQIPNDYILSTDLIMGGTYVIDGRFEVPLGVTVYVSSYGTNGCGELKIYADEIIVLGTINGDFAGYEGGSGGNAGSVVSSITGHQVSLTSCNDSGSQGKITVQAGIAGTNGSGPGAGNAGGNGSEGSGPKQYCGNTGDDAGLIGGSGGSGGGAGGSYGGIGGNGANGGMGSGASLPTNLNIESSYPVIGGSGGIGGLATSNYGTTDGRDVSIGSGGGGSGGGGRSYYEGTNGAKGGNGGGMIFLKANDELIIEGLLTVAGENGAIGGDGGSGDATADCCSDGCNGCDERTFSAGAGSGAGAGGGSGGGIFLESLGTADISGTLVVAGGDGGDGGQQGVGVTCNYDGGVFCGTQSITTGDGTRGNKGGAGAGGRIKIFVADCASAVINATVETQQGTGFGTATEGSYEEVCGYLNVNETAYSIGWSIYPNPTTDEITIEILSERTIGSVNELMVFNGLGQLVHKDVMSGDQLKLDVSAWEKGIYNIQIINEFSTETKKLIKQ